MLVCNLKLDQSYLSYLLLMAIHNQCLLLLLCLLNQREISTLKTRCDSTYPAFVVCSLLPAQGGNRVSSSEAYLGKNTDFSSLRNSTLLSQLLTDEGIASSSNEWERNKSVWSCERRNRGVSKAFVFLPCQRDKRCQKCCQMHRTLLTSSNLELPPIFFCHIQFVICNLL